MNSRTIHASLVCALVLLASGTVRLEAGLQDTTTALPQPLKALHVPTEVVGGNSVEGTVELIQAPGPNGLTVQLQSSWPASVWVPDSVTITQGATSAETGPVFKKKFIIRTQPHDQGTMPVRITARAGTQILETILTVMWPRLHSGSLTAPTICNGESKANVTYTLTGPAIDRLHVQVSLGLYKIVDRTNLSPSGSAGVVEEVTSRTHGGTVSLVLPRCEMPPGQRCVIRGGVWLWKEIGSGRKTDLAPPITLNGACVAPN